MGAEYRSGVQHPGARLCMHHVVLLERLFIGYATHTAMLTGSIPLFALLFRDRMTSEFWGPMARTSSPPWTRTRWSCHACPRMCSASLTWVASPAAASSHEVRLSRRSGGSSACWGGKGTREREGQASAGHGAGPTTHQTCQCAGPTSSGVGQQRAALPVILRTCKDVMMHAGSGDAVHVVIESQDSRTVKR